MATKLAPAKRTPATRVAPVKAAPPPEVAVVAPQEASVQETIKQFNAPLPFDSGVNWFASDHSIRIAQINSDAQAAGYAVVGEPEFIGHERDEDGPNHDSTILNYKVQFKKA
jgi:hypothetical protein